MTVMSNEDPADPSAHGPRVTGSPAAIWLCYGDLEHDDTHDNCWLHGEVTWCADHQAPSDVRYVRADVAEAQTAVVAEGWRELAQGALAALVWEAGSEASLYAAQTATAIQRLRAALGA